MPAGTTIEDVIKGRLGIIRIAALTKSMETEEPRLAAPASPRNDEKAFEYPLPRSVSFRTANIGAPTSQAHHRFHGGLQSVSCFLLWLIEITVSTDLRGRRSGRCPQSHIPSKERNFYLEMVNFS